MTQYGLAVLTPSAFSTQRGGGGHGYTQAAEIWGRELAQEEVPGPPLGGGMWGRGVGPGNSVIPL